MTDLMTFYPKVEIVIEPPLAHLSYNEIHTLAQEFYSGAYSREELEMKYQIKVIAPYILEHYIPAFHHPECICPNCEVVSWMYICHPNEDNEPFCPICRHFLYSELNSYASFMDRGIKKALDEMFLEFNKVCDIPEVVAI